MSDLIPAENIHPDSLELGFAKLLPVGGRLTLAGAIWEVASHNPKKATISLRLLAVKKTPEPKEAEYGTYDDNKAFAPA